MRVEATSVRAGTAPERSAGLIVRWVLVSLALLAVVAALVGLAFAGSTARIADGVAIAGVDVGGLTPRQAVLVRPDGHRAAVLTDRTSGLKDQVTAALQRATGW